MPSFQANPGVFHVKSSLFQANPGVFHVKSSSLLKKVAGCFLTNHAVCFPTIGGIFPKAFKSFLFFKIPYRDYFVARLPV
jgi:hypothetical protein